MGGLVVPRRWRARAESVKLHATAWLKQGRDKGAPGPFLVIPTKSGLLGVVGHEVVVMGAAGLGLSGWVVLNHPSDRRKPRCHDPP